jgi:hypothetical protein
MEDLLRILRLILSLYDLLTFQFQFLGLGHENRKEKVDPRDALLNFNAKFVFGL